MSDTWISFTLLLSSGFCGSCARCCLKHLHCGQLPGSYVLFGERSFSVVVIVVIISCTAVIIALIVILRYRGKKKKEAKAAQ